MKWKILELSIGIIAIVLLVILGWVIVINGFPDQIKGDPAETMAQWREYERLAREYPVK